MITWTIGIHWNCDGDFSDTNEDVTSLLISATWVLGTQKPWQDIADTRNRLNTTATILNAK